MFHLLFRFALHIRSALAKSRDVGRARNAFLKQLVTQHSLATLSILALLWSLHVWLVVSGQVSSSPTAAQLYKVGGGWGPSVAHGEAWRMITSIFLHAGTAHLLGNTIGLLAGGLLVDWLVGPASFLTIYFLGGCFGAALSAIFHPTLVSVGASGAIFSVYGAIIAGLIYSARLREMKGTRGFFIAALVHALLALNSGLQQGHFVDNFAHLGGFFAGFAITCVWYLDKNDARHRQLTFLGAGVFLLVSGLFIVPRMIHAHRMNPVQAEAVHKLNMRRIDAVASLLTSFGTQTKGLSDPEAVRYTRDAFVPKYKRALEDLGLSVNEEASSPKEAKLNEIMYAAFSRCGQMYTFIATDGREPASLNGRRPRLRDLRADCERTMRETEATLQTLK